ncbi:hypothetical protein CP967_02000 [Streptomyces nitrosporeus]|uniref:Transposase n=1 Tax=Streptomyces nitrosporeus TaxID=28894 RepID=A0A5J6F3W8_9ACTN|nr:hypothetical protein CP967_02000 [Streptomyces nitrosporeus]GGZ20305.1 hypothetical protein GCM10010327_59260 [Streptomyces nitrosporeus]
MAGRTTPERADRTGGRLRRGSPPSFGKQPRRRHNDGERCFNRLKRRRGTSIRYDGAAESAAAVTPVSLLTRA